MTEGYEIRPAREQDEPKISALVKTKPEKLLQEIPAWQDFFVAVTKDGKVIGCAALQVSDKKEGAELRSVVVAEGHNCGVMVGSRLVRACIQKGKDMGLGQIKARTDEPRYFRRFGFLEVETTTKDKVGKTLMICKFQ